MADHDSNNRNTSPQLDARQIVQETQAIARESLVALFRSWLEVPEGGDLPMNLREEQAAMRARQQQQRSTKRRGEKTEGTRTRQIAEPPVMAYRNAKAGHSPEGCDHDHSNG